MNPVVQVVLGFIPSLVVIHSRMVGGPMSYFKGSATCPKCDTTLTVDQELDGWSVRHKVERIDYHGTCCGVPYVVILLPAKRDCKCCGQEVAS